MFSLYFTNDPLMLLRYVNDLGISRIAEGKIKAVTVQQGRRADDGAHGGVQNSAMRHHQILSRTTPDNFFHCTRRAIVNFPVTFTGR